MVPDTLELTLLGPPRLTYDGARVSIPSRKGLALVIYLAVERRHVPRPVLAELLWGEDGADNLRQELSKLRRLSGADAWFVSDDALSVRAITDVAAFEEAVGSRNDIRALELAQGPFVEGLRVPRAPMFAEWVGEQRSRLDALKRTALKGWADALADDGRATEAIEALRRALDLDPLGESAHRRIMRLQYGRGHLQAAASWRRRAIPSSRRGLREFSRPSMQSRR